MRAPDGGPLGEATVAVRFEGWPEGRVAPSTHRIPVVSRKPLPAVKLSPQQRNTWSFESYSINDLRYTPDGRTLVVVLDKRLKDGHLYQFRLWDVASGKERAKVLQIDPEPLKIIYSPYLAVSADGKSLSVRYNLLRFTKVGKDYKDRENGVVHVIDLDSGRQRWTHEWDAQGVYGASFSPDGRTLVTGHTHVTKTGEGRDQQREYTGTVRFWDAATGGEKGNLPGGPYQIVQPLGYSPDGKSLLLMDHHRDWKKQSSEYRLQVWDLTAGKARLQLRGPNPIHAGVFSPDSARLATVTHKEGVKVWGLETGKEAASLPLSLEKGYVLHLGWSADDKRLFMGSTQGQLWRWGPGGSEPPVKVESIPLEAKQPRRNAWAQHWHLASGLYAFGVNGELPKRLTQRTLDEDYAELPPPEIVLWDLKTMRRRATLTGHHGQVECLAFSPDGKALASGGTDGTVRLWDVAGRSP